MNHERVNVSLQICTATSTPCRHLVSLLLGRIQFQTLGETRRSESVQRPKTNLQGKGLPVLSPKKTQKWPISMWKDV